jgi:hypothetical protein
MDTEAFIRWALDPARTVDELYPVELLVEFGMGWWTSRHNAPMFRSHEEQAEMQRQRALNPAWRPTFTELDLRRAAEYFPEIHFWWPHFGLEDRPIRNLQALAFFTHLDSLHLNNVEVTNVSPLAALTRLRVLHFGSHTALDLRPLRHCTGLRELQLTLNGTYRRNDTYWPLVTGLEELQQLETFSLSGNLLAFPPGVSWPRVRTATLNCEPLPARRVRELPHLPVCEFLTLGGVESLEGIEQFPKLRNLTLVGPVRDFAPLAGLRELTCLTVKAHEPLDVTPLTRVPKLQCLTFDTRFLPVFRVVRPRDFAPLADALALRELHVHGCPPVADEVRMLNSLLAQWNDDLLLATPRPLGALEFIVAPHEQHPHRHQPVLEPTEGDLPDVGLRECEGRWVARHTRQRISATLACDDWGNVRGDALYRTVHVDFEAYSIVEKFPLAVQAVREVIAQLRGDYRAHIMIRLRAPAPPATPAQKELEAQFRDEQDRAEYERRKKEQAEYLERLHRYELKQQLGDKINPKEFAVPPPTPLPPAPWEREDDDDDSATSDGDLLVKEKPDPPPSWFDDEHPLADQYRLWAQVTLNEFWVSPHQLETAGYLLGRSPDRVIPEDPPAAVK